jgi:L-Ala-D/L-Glu epimerase
LRLSYEILELETRHSFHIARAAAPASRRNVWVKLSDDGALEGWGEAAPNAFYTETTETVVDALERMRPLLDDVHCVMPGRLGKLEQELHEIAPRASSARAAVSAAMFDLIGKRLQQPVWKMFGVNPACAPLSSFTIGIDRIEMMREKVREAGDYPVLKIKVGTPNDERVLAMLRDERPDASIRVDANTGWTVEEALENLSMLEAYGVELIEQPVHPEDLQGLARVKQASSIPIIADESCKTAEDVDRLAGCVDGVNIKLAKCGSLLEGIRIATTARRYGMRVMVGCMIESTLGIAASAQLAPLADWVDLDGAALLAYDYFQGPHLQRDGQLELNRGAGLGVALAEAEAGSLNRRWVATGK